MGKINFNELQEMLRDGRTQADCARHFQVSGAAVCKAVKRLNAAEIPASMEKLTDKERVFVLNLAEGKNATESALIAYDCTSRDVAKTLGCRMAKDPDVTLALSDIMAQEAIPLRRRIQRLKDLIESKDLSAVSRGLDQSWRLDGSYAPEKFDVRADMAVRLDVIALIKQQQEEKERLGEERKSLDEEKKRFEEERSRA